MARQKCVWLPLLRGNCLAGDTVGMRPRVQGQVRQEKQFAHSALSVISQLRCKLHVESRGQKGVVDMGMARVIESRNVEGSRLIPDGLCLRSQGTDE